MTTKGNLTKHIEQALFDKAYKEWRTELDGDAYKVASILCGVGEDFKVTTHGLMSYCHMSERKITKALKTLKAKGYLTANEILTVNGKRVQYTITNVKHANVTDFAGDEITLEHDDEMNTRAVDNPYLQNADMQENTPCLRFEDVETYTYTKNNNKEYSHKVDNQIYSSINLEGEQNAKKQALEDRLNHAKRFLVKWGIFGNWQDETFALMGNISKHIGRQLSDNDIDIIAEFVALDIRTNGDIGEIDGYLKAIGA